jgi:oligopeptidase A
MSELPLTKIELPIPFDRVSAQHVEPAVDALLEAAKKAIDAIGDAPRTYDKTLGVLDMASETLDWAVNVAGHLESVVGDADIRAAYTAILPKLSAFASSIVLSAPLYRAFRELAASDEARSLDPARRRFLDKTLADFRRNGAELDDAGKARLTAIDAALSERTLQFSQNVVDATAAFEIMVDDRGKLAGLPDGAIEAAQRSAREKGKSGYRFTLQAPSFGPVMSFAEDRSLRERMYRAYNTRASGGRFDNWPIASEVLALRHEKARLLGFAHFADLALDDRMLKSGKDALAFASMLRDKLLPSFEREKHDLAAFAAKTGHCGPLEAWDVSYWSEKQRRALYDFDEETLRPYHPLDRVLRGLFEIAQSLYGIRIERDATAPVWHPEASAYVVASADGRRIGTFYLDLYPRETKRDGAWMGGIADRLPGTPYERESVAMIVTNVTRPRGPGVPALLTHREIETLFHEFGHMLHWLLSDSPIRSMAGTRVVSDFVELPSMIMENWTWERDALDRFARHVDSGEPIPDAIKDRMLRARTYRAANQHMAQVGYATLDLLLHTAPEVPADLPTFAREAFAPFAAAPLPPDYAMLAAFSHLFGAPYGYAAGYYSYEWARVLEADAFGRFRSEGILSPHVGSAFRSLILAPGDTEDPAVLYRRFLGRDPDPSTFLTQLGLVA